LPRRPRACAPGPAATARAASPVHKPIEILFSRVSTGFSFSFPRGPPSSGLEQPRPGGEGSVQLSRYFSLAFRFREGSAGFQQGFSGAPCNPMGLKGSHRQRCTWVCAAKGAAERSRVPWGVDGRIGGVSSACTYSPGRSAISRVGEGGGF
jgi:hypothetical protein